MTPEAIEAAIYADWEQVVRNGGPPCFHLEDGRFCFRAERWEGHEPGQIHRYVPLAGFLVMHEPIRRNHNDHPFLAGARDLYGGVLLGLPDLSGVLEIKMIALLRKLFRRDGKPELRLKIETKPSGTFLHEGMTLLPGASADLPMPDALAAMIHELQRAGAVITTESDAPVEIGPKKFTQDHHIQANGKPLATYTLFYDTK